MANLQIIVIPCYWLCLTLSGNVRRYVQLAQSRGGACFCTRGAMQDYDFRLFILALAKTMTAGGVARPSGNRKVYTLMFVPLAGRQLHIPPCYGQLISYFIIFKISILVVLSNNIIGTSIRSIE